MTSHKAQVAVLGAGPAGSIAARQLGQAGVDVFLIDAGASSSSHTIESFPPSGAPLAEDIGLLAAICNVSDGPAGRMHMHWRDTPETRVFEGDGPLLLRRKALHEMLRSEARRVARLLETRVRKINATDTGAEVKTDAGPVFCDLIVDARGRHATKRPASDLVALPFSAQISGAEHTMWLEAQPEGWLWASSVQSGEGHGVLFQRATVLSGTTAQARLDYARQCLASSDAFADGSGIKVGTPAAAGLSAVEDPVPAGRHVLIGDAALARDPIASHGLVHAIRSAVQAAVAVRTILDPAGDSHAAISFLRHKHSEAVAAARRATARPYRDQCRFSGSIWSHHAIGPKTEPACSLGSGPVTLANPLTRAPVLESDGIRWVPAIEMSAKHDFFTGVGPVTALNIAAACRPAAPLQDVAIRLGQAHPMPVVFRVLEHLALGGAFVQETRSL